MDFQSAQAHLAQAAARGIRPGLDAIRALLHQLGDPQKQLKFVHVAGTNGKGATASMIAAIAAQAGIRTGCYTSPAVFDDMEKFRIDGAPISREAFAGCMAQIAAAEARMQADDQPLPTSFEIETALALLTFREQGCALAVLETGMGGRMDATNVIDAPLVCVLTAIGMDHTKFLGDTLEQIAKEKAGIIKPGCEVVLEGQSDVVRSVVEAACREQGARLTVTAPERILPGSPEEGEGCFSYGGLPLALSLQGAFQRENAIAAVETARSLNRRGFSIPDSAIQDALRGFRWPGRLERIRIRPDLYLDGAHNPNAARRLAEALPTLLHGRRLICVMGVLADKDYSSVAALVCSLAAHTYTVTPENPRALEAGALAGTVARHCPATATGSVQEALMLAIRDAGPDGVVLAFGSLSYLKEACRCAQQLLPSIEE